MSPSVSAAASAIVVAVHVSTTLRVFAALAGGPEVSDHPGHLSRVAVDAGGWRYISGRQEAMSAEVQIENADVRATRWTLAQGEETGQHRHEYDYVVVPLAAAGMHVHHADGKETTSELATGESYYKQAGAEHNVRNEDEAVLDFVEVEVVRPRPQA
jgi:quercetin dioxygenase-like cupin family protein